MSACASRTSRPNGRPDASHLERVISSLRGLPYVNQTDTILLLLRLLNRPMGDSTSDSS